MTTRPPVPVPQAILFVAWAPFYSGAERALLLTLRALDRDRFVPVAVVGTDGGLKAELEADGVDTHLVPIRYADRKHPVDWVRSVAAIARIASRTRAALVHANDCPSFQPAGYAARLLRIPAVTHVRFPDTHDGFSWFLRPGFARALFVSEYLRQDATAVAPRLFDGRSDVILDGVDLPPVPDQAGRRRLQLDLGLPLDRPSVVIAGQVAEVKGIWEFVEAAHLLVGRGVDATFVVLGDDLKEQGKTRRMAEQRVRDLGLSPHFVFLGFRANASRLIPAFDIVAVPSHVEPLGNATLEAMAASRPVVGSRVGGIPEMVVDRETGLLVPPRAPDALATALEAVVRDAELRERLGRAGRRRAETVFSLEAHGSRLREIYEGVLRPAAHEGHGP